VLDSLQHIYTVLTGAALQSARQNKEINQWLGGVTVRPLDSRSRDRGFDSRSDRYQVVTTWIGDLGI